MSASDARTARASSSGTPRCFRFRTCRNCACTWRVEATELWQKTEDELGQIGLPPPFWAFAWAGGQALARYVIDIPKSCAADAFSISPRAPG